MATQSEYLTIAQAAKELGQTKKTLNSLLRNYATSGGFGTQLEREYVRIVGRLRCISKYDIPSLRSDLESLGFYGHKVRVGQHEQKKVAPGRCGSFTEHVVWLESYLLGKGVCVRMTPSEAIRLADQLLEKACEAEELTKKAANDK